MCARKTTHVSVTRSSPLLHKTPVGHASQMSIVSSSRGTGHVAATLAVQFFSCQVAATLTHKLCTTHELHQAVGIMNSWSIIQSLPLIRVVQGRVVERAWVQMCKGYVPCCRGLTHAKPTQMVQRMQVASCHHAAQILQHANLHELGKLPSPVVLFCDAAAAPAQQILCCPAGCVAPLPLAFHCHAVPDVQHPVHRHVPVRTMCCTNTQPIGSRGTTHTVWHASTILAPWYPQPHPATT
jgi:hypothetical protein